MNNEAARYRIQAVSDITGVSAATLRAWERRYGFPTPQRTDSAYRLYSREDVELVKRMQSMVEAGVAPNEAARELLAASREAEPPAADVDPFEAVAERIVGYARSMDLPGLQRELQRAILMDAGTVAFERILRPALVKIGEGWHDGSISIAAEHLASQLITTTVQDLLRLTRVADDARTVVLGCFAEELHALPLLGVALSFATLGVRPVVLGARTPPSAIARAIEALEPDFVGLSVTVTPHPPSHARELVDGYADACGQTPWFVGGSAAESVRGFVEARGGALLDGTLAGVERAIDRANRRPRDGAADRRKTPRR